MTEARTKELYVEVEKELLESIITVADASSSPLYMQALNTESATSGFFSNTKQDVPALGQEDLTAKKIGY